MSNLILNPTQVLHYDVPISKFEEEVNKLNQNGWLVENASISKIDQKIYRVSARYIGWKIKTKGKRK